MDRSEVLEAANKGGHPHVCTDFVILNECWRLSILQSDLCRIEERIAKQRCVKDGGRTDTQGLAMQSEVALY